MKISQKGDYAIRALLDIAQRQKDKEVVPLSDISKRQQIPEPFLAHIMLILKKADLIDSRRGAGGGFFLKKRPQEITLGNVIRLIDGPIDPSAGMNAKTSTEQHPNAEQQALQEVWMNVTRAISDTVDRVTFADLMCRADELREQNSDFNYMI